MTLHSLPLAATAAALRSGTLPLHGFLDAVCNRIDTGDGAIQSLLPEAGRRARLHADAEALLAAWPDPSTRPPLFGIPAGIKDIFHVDGFVTQAGSVLPPESFAGAEAEVARRLKSAGALVLGKTVTTEFAYFEPGPTRNPHNLDHTPGGSSSGSAAAVAAGFAALGVGTQTIGSVIRPAAFCGVTGFKPTQQRLPSAGLVFFSPTMDHVGLFTQGAEGMALAAAALLDGWRGLKLGAHPPRLAVPEGPYLDQAAPDGAAGFARALAALARAGFAVRRIPLFAAIEIINQEHRRLVFGEFARQHADLYARFGALYRPRTREIVEIGRGVSETELDDLRARALARRAEVEALMEAEDIDLWISPAAPGPAPAGIHATGDPNMNLPWTHTGQPAITLRAGRAAGGLPLGLQISGRFGADEDLLAWAIVLEPALR